MGWGCPRSTGAAGISRNVQLPFAGIGNGAPRGAVIIGFGGLGGRYLVFAFSASFFANVPSLEESGAWRAFSAIILRALSIQHVEYPTCRRIRSAQPAV